MRARYLDPCCSPDEFLSLRQTSFLSLVTLVTLTFEDPMDQSESNVSSSRLEQTGSLLNRSPTFSPYTGSVYTHPDTTIPGRNSAIETGSSSCAARKQISSNYLRT